MTIAIVTRRRPLKLKRCLKSIVAQTRQPFRVIVVDNDATGSARDLVNFFTDKLNISYVQESIQSVPKSRNLALKVAKNSILGFVDDDCVLNHDWIEEVMRSIKKNKADYLIGKTELYNPKNFLALAQFQRETYWFKKALMGRKAGRNNVDTKNLVLNLKQIKNNNISFDEGAVIGPYDSADFALGVAMENVGLKGFFEKRVILRHEEGRSFKRYVKRAYFRGKNTAFLTQKYNLKNIFKNSFEKNLYTRFRDFFKDFGKEREMYCSDLDCSRLKKTIITFLAKIYEYSFEAGFHSYKK